MGFNIDTVNPLLDILGLLEATWTTGFTTLRDSIAR